MSIEKNLEKPPIIIVPTQETPNDPLAYLRPPSLDQVVEKYAKKTPDDNYRKTPSGLWVKAYNAPTTQIVIASGYSNQP